VEKIVRAKEGERERDEDKERSISLSEIPGMNGGINFPREGGKPDGMQRIYAVKASSW